MTGIINLSPSWFSQGHEGPLDSLHVSSDIEQAENVMYLKNLVFINALVARVYSIIQPDLFDSGYKALDQLTEHSQLNNTILNALEAWSTPFTGLSVILNRETITHRDIKGYRESFDMLVTIGDYSEGRLHLPGLGFSLVYNPGTLVAIAGNILAHGVCSVAGERACLAHFWHRNVGERLGVEPPQWRTLQDLTENIHSM